MVDPNSIRKSLKYVICLMLERNEPIACYKKRWWTVPSLAPLDPQFPWDPLQGKRNTRAVQEITVDRLLESGLIEPVSPPGTQKTQSVFALSERGVEAAQACQGWYLDAKRADAYRAPYRGFGNG